MRITAIAGLVGVLVIASAGAGQACVCSCDGSYTSDRYISEASVIVVGRVVAIGQMPADSDAADDGVTHSDCVRKVIKVSVLEVLSGCPASPVSFVQGDAGTSCDFTFPIAEGEEYLLFGFLGKDGSLNLSGCSPSAPLASAGKVIKRIRKQLR